MGFGSIHTENFAAWKGKRDGAEFLALCTAIKKRIGSSKEPFIPQSTGQQESKNKKVAGVKFYLVAFTFVAIVLITLRIIDPSSNKIINQKREVASTSIEETAELSKQEQKRANHDNKTAQNNTESKINKTDKKNKNSVAINSEETNQLRQLIKEPEMVRIAAGSFNMGSNRYESEQPVHHVSLNSFTIGRYEVTFEEYDQYANSVGKSKPIDSGWGRGKRQ